MNKSELAKWVSSETSLSKADSERAINAVFEGIAKTLKKGDKASFVGVGTFSVSRRQARTGRNPRTGEAIKIPASNQPKFKPGKELKSSVN